MNFFDKNNRIVQYSFLFINVAWVGLFFVVMLNRAYPIIGHDYTYFISRTLDSYLHYRVNGLSVQWYTPSFGGGLPSYANPQQTQFSLVQFLTFIFDPWDSILVSIVVYASLGILCFYLFAKNVLELDWRASLLGGVFFVFTGFYIGHTISGQLGFLTFPLLSPIILILFWRRWSDLLAGVVMGLLTASLIYQAGFYTLVIFALSCGMTLPMLYLINPQLFSFSSLTKRVVIAGVFFAALSLSKGYAIYTLMRYFPREITYEYWSDYTNSAILPIISFFAQLLGTTTLAPLMAFAGQDVNSLELILSHFSGYPYSHIWETDNSVSPALIFILLAALIQRLRARDKINLTGLSKDKLAALVICIAATWFTLEYTLAKGWLYSFASQLPVFSSLHINFRFMSAFFFPLALSGALIAHHWLKEIAAQKANIIFIILNVVTLVSPLAYFLYEPELHFRAFNAEKILDAYQQVKHGETFPVTRVADDTVRDWDAIPLGVTTTNLYEPVFGYGLESFTPQTHPGPVSAIADGFYNLTNPASLTFPESNGGKLFSLFTADDGERLDQFTQRRQPDWKIPRIQIAMNVISGISFFISLTVILLNIFIPLIRKSDWQSDLPPKR